MSRTRRPAGPFFYPGGTFTSRSGRCRWEWRDPLACVIKEERAVRDRRGWTRLQLCPPAVLSPRLEFGWSWGWSWGPAMAPAGHSPGSSHLPYSSVLVLQLGFVLSNFPSFIPRPCSAFRASRGILRPRALPSHKGSVTTPTRSILSPVWTGARTRLCRTSLLVTFGGREDACSKWWKERN